jgi:quercetin dioxygenase-like cupin family protein
MYLTDLEKSKEIDITPEKMKEKGRVTVRWLLGEPEGAPGFEMRYFSLSGDISTDWHNHEWEHQVFVIRGKGKFRSEEREVSLEPGCAVLVHPNEQHHFICDGEQFEFICVVPRGTRTCMIGSDK